MNGPETRAGDTHPDDIAYLSALVRTNDRPRYYATLFAPAALRPDLFALYGFAAEIARIPDQVIEPTLGQIRLQWWRDGLHAVTAHEAQGETPALRGVTDVIARHSLPVEPLLSLIDARSADLYSDPPPTTADLEDFIGRTQSPLFLLGAAVTGASMPDVATAAQHAGVAYGLARRMAALAADRAGGRTVLTHDLLGKEGLQASDVFASKPHPGLRKVVIALSDLAREHLRAAREHLPELPRKVWPVFLPLVVVEPLLARIDRLGTEILDRSVDLPDLEALLRIAWARLWGCARGTRRSG
jgi:phytoene synthase